jgi:Na+-driven multidrug efflux pump
MDFAYLAPDIVRPVERAANAFVIVFLAASSLFMVALPILLFYAVMGIPGIIAGLVVASLFWALVAVQFMRVRRRRPPA